MKRMIMIAATAGIAGIGMANIALAASEPMVRLSTAQQKLSYTIGFETGRAFKAHGVDLNIQAFNLGVKDGVGGKRTMLTDSQRHAIMKQYQKDAAKRAEERVKKEATTNQKKGEAFLAKNKSKAGVKTLPSGLQYKILKKGSGPQPNKGDIVKVNYKGSLIDGTVFDSSYKRGAPAVLPLGAVIKGWQEALVRMHTGATWELYIPAKLAYGKYAPPKIGPNQTLIFQVELLAIVKK